MSTKSSIHAGHGEVTLGTNSSALDRGLAAAGKSMQAFGGIVMTTGAGIMAAGTAMLAPFGAGVAAFVSMGSAMQDMSDRTGVTVEALSGLIYAAEQSDASAEDLQKALREMSKTLVEVARGAPPATATLEALGITLDELQGLSPDQQFRRFAEAISKIENPALRSALANEVFGKSTSKLMPLLLSGADGIKKFEDRARQLGLIMSGADAAAAEGFGDRLTDLSTIGKFMAFQFGAALLPVLQSLVMIFIDVAAAVNRFLQENRGLVQALFIGIVAGIAFGAALVLLGGTIYVVGGIMTWFSGVMVACGGVWGLLKAAIILGVPGLATAFALFRASVWAWGTGTAAASALARGAMAAFGFTAIATMFAVKAAAYLLVGALLAIPVAILAIKLAFLSVAVALSFLTIGIPIAIAFFVGKWIAGTELVRNSIATIRNVLATVGGWIRSVFGPVIDWIVNAVRSVAGWIANVFMNIFGPLIGSIGAAFSRIGTMISNITNIVSGAVSATVSGFTTLFSGLVGTAMSAWGGIRDAFAVGDWAGMWEIVKVAAQIAWLQISQFLRKTWITWKYAGIAVWNQITDGLKDAFTLVWVELRVLFERGWAFVKSGWWTVVGVIMDALSMLARPIAAVLRAMALVTPDAIGGQAIETAAANVGAINGDTARERARQANEAGGLAELVIRDRRRIEQDERRVRTRRDLENRLAQAREIGGVNNAPEIARLQVQLDALNLDAWIAAQQQLIQGFGAGGPGGEGAELARAAGASPSVSGSFFADAFRGMAGASRSPAEVTNDRLAAMIRQNDELIRELRRVQGVGFA